MNDGVAARLMTSHGTGTVMASRANGNVDVIPDVRKSVVEEETYQVTVV